jgi:hypothetical protein
MTDSILKSIQGTISEREYCTNNNPDLAIADEEVQVQARSDRTMNMHH